MTKDSGSRDRSGPFGVEPDELLANGELPTADTAADGAEAVSVAADELRREVELQKDRYLRLAAEFQNFRRRTNEEKIELGNRAQAALSATLLEAIDDLARFEAADVAKADAAALVQGVALVSRKLQKALATAGLEIVNPTDAPFNPAVHEAVSIAPAQSPEDDDMVAAVFQPGYLFKGQLLRPAKVSVKKWQG